MRTVLPDVVLNSLIIKATVLLNLRRVVPSVCSLKLVVYKSKEDHLRKWPMFKTSVPFT